jgi:hypothetical protein
MITEIQSQFIRDGSYTNQFDEFGNLVIIDSTEKYLAVTLTPEVYEITSVTNVYTIGPEEFKDVPRTEDPKLVALKSEKTTLQNKITTLTSELSKMSNSSGKDALISASKDTIVGLRIKSGEGKTPSDFNTVFPYLPLKSQEAIQSDASSTGLGSSTPITSTSTENVSTESTSTKLTGAQTGLVVSTDQCQRQQDIQLSPPLDFTISTPPIRQPVAPSTLISSPLPVESLGLVEVIMPTPVHQIAVQKVVPPISDSCIEKFYPYGKYDTAWPSYNVGKSPLIYSYGVYSNNVGESFQTESSDTLSYQVYIPYTGIYTLKFSADNSGYFAINGVRRIDLTNVTSQSPYTSQVDVYMGDHPNTVQLTEGWTTVDLFYKNWGGPHSVAAVIIYDGRIIWNSRNAYNQKDYNECKGIGNVGTSPIVQVLPSEDCVNPISIFKFTGNVDHTLRITLQSTKVTYSNEQYHGILPRVVSDVTNNGVGPYDTKLQLKSSGRGSVQITQHPNSSNSYTAIIDIFDGRGSEGSYNIEILQLKCSKSSTSTSTSQLVGGNNRDGSLNLRDNDDPVAVNRSLRWSNWLLGKITGGTKAGGGASYTDKQKAALINSISPAQYEQYKQQWNRFNAGNPSSQKR